MKKLLIFLILVILLTPSLAKTDRVKMRIGDSRLIENINVTLLNLDSKDDKVIICVNSKKAIVTDDEEKRVNNVRIEVRDVKENYAELELEADCDDCVCNTVECSNKACFPEPEIIEQEITEPEEKQPEPKTTQEPPKPLEKPKTLLEKIIDWFKTLF